MFCSNCGKTVNDGAKFCAECGSAVAATHPSNHVQQPVQQPVMQPAVLRPSACPKCNAPGMVVVIKRSTVGFVLVVLGIGLTPFTFSSDYLYIGTLIFVVGFIIRWGGKGQPGYRRPVCNYQS
jgi:uncharacterized membrane protein YvbJ